MLSKFIDSVLIIDDQEEEVSGLIELFEKNDIWVKYINPPSDRKEIQERFKQPIRNRKLIFLDLKLDDTKTTKDNISTLIRPLLASLIGKNFGSYGIVMWTRNEDHINEFKEKIILDKAKYTLPLFVIGLDKQKYLQNDFNDLFDDLKSKLQQNVAANFLIKWSTLIEYAKNSILQDIFHLAEDYNSQNNNLQYILYHMAKNHFGLGDDFIDDNSILAKEAFSAFSGLFQYHLQLVNLPESCKLFSSPNEIKYIFIKEGYQYEKKGNEYIVNGNPIEKKDLNRKMIDQEIGLLFAKLNSKLLLDFNPFGLKPGNIYIDAGLCYVSKEITSDDIPIVIELSPPCDYANTSKKRGLPKFVSGFISKYDQGRLKKLNSDALYTEAYPLYIENLPIMGDGIYMLTFDFRYINNIHEKELQIKNYKYLFRVKDNLFADILQKMSSYTARLGLSIIR